MLGNSSNASKAPPVFTTGSLPFPIFALAPARDEDQPPTVHAVYAVEAGQLVSDAPAGPVAFYAPMLSRACSLAGNRIHASHATAEAALHDAVKAQPRSDRLMANVRLDDLFDNRGPSGSPRIP